MQIATIRMTVSVLLRCFMLPLGGESNPAAKPFRGCYFFSIHTVTSVDDVMRVTIFMLGRFIEQ